jgi:ferredoxin
MNAPNLVPNPNAVMMQNGAVGMPHMAAGNNGIGECAFCGACRVYCPDGVERLVVIECLPSYAWLIMGRGRSSLLRTISPFNIPIHDMIITDRSLSQLPIKRPTTTRPMVCRVPYLPLVLHNNKSSSHRTRIPPSPPSSKQSLPRECTQLLSHNST